VRPGLRGRRCRRPFVFRGRVDARSGAGAGWPDHVAIPASHGGRPHRRRGGRRMGSGGFRRRRPRLPFAMARRRARGAGRRVVGCGSQGRRIARHRVVAGGVRRSADHCLAVVGRAARRRRRGHRDVAPQPAGRDALAGQAGALGPPGGASPAAARAVSGAARAAPAVGRAPDRRAVRSGAGSARRGAHPRHRGPARSGGAAALRARRPRPHPRHLGTARGHSGRRAAAGAPRRPARLRRGAPPRRWWRATSASSGGLRPRCGPWA
jgi:hypothetical protein